MADVEKDIVLRVKSETDQATGQFKNLKQELRSIENQLNQMAQSGDTGSKAFQQLQRRAGEVKDQLGDTKAAIKALSSDTFKLDAFTQAAQGIAGGFAAAQGAMALFGTENKQVEEAIKKTQGAMALLQGVTAITNILQKQTAFMTGVNTVAQKAYAFAVGTSTGAMKAFRIALATTGILLVVGAIVMAADALGAFSDAEEEAEDKIKKTNEALKERKEALDENMKSNQSYIDRSIELIKVEEEIKTLSLNKEKNYKRINELQKKAIDLQLRQLGVELATKKGLLTTQEEFKLKEQIYKLQQERSRLEIQFALDEDTRAKEAKEKTKKEKEEKEKQAKEAKEKAEKDAKELRDFQDKERQQSLDADRVYFEKYMESDRFNTDQKIEKAKEFYLQGTISEKEYNDILAKFQQERKDLNDKEHQQDINAQKTSFDLAIQSEQLKINKKKELAKQAYLDGIISEKEYQETIAGLDTKAFQIKQANINKWGKLTIDGLNALTELNNAFSKKDEVSQKKAFERNKKFSIAQALISTFLAVNGALTAGGNPVKFATGAQFVEAGIALTMGLAQVAKISKTQFSGGGQDSGGGGGGLGSIPTPSTMATQTSGLDSTQLQLDAQGNLMQQRTMRTYVLETDISAKQQRSKRLQQTATLGK